MVPAPLGLIVWNYPKRCGVNNALASTPRPAATDTATSGETLLAAVVRQTDFGHSSTESRHMEASSFQASHSQLIPSALASRSNRRSPTSHLQPAGLNQFYFPGYRTSRPILQLFRLRQDKRCLCFLYCRHGFQAQHYSPELRNLPRTCPSSCSTTESPNLDGHFKTRCWSQLPVHYWASPLAPPRKPRQWPACHPLMQHRGGRRHCVWSRDGFPNLPAPEMCFDFCRSLSACFISTSSSQLTS